MPVATERRFTLADGMILVAATAAGLSIYRDLMRPRLSVSLPVEIPVWKYHLSQRLSASFGVVLPLMAASILLRFRRPRPPSGELGRQPGLNACLAAYLALGFWWIFHYKWLDLTMDWVDVLFGLFWPTSGFAAQMIALAIAADWMALVVSGQWRAEAHWIDRLGRALGLVGIVLPIVSTTLGP